MVRSVGRRLFEPSDHAVRRRQIGVADTKADNLDTLGFLLKAESEVPFLRPLSLEREAGRAVLRLDCSWGIPQRAVTWLKKIAEEVIQEE